MYWEYQKYQWESYTCPARFANNKRGKKEDARKEGKLIKVCKLSLLDFLYYFKYYNLVLLIYDIVNDIKIELKAKYVIQCIWLYDVSYATSNRWKYNSKKILYISRRFDPRGLGSSSLQQ